MRPLGISGGWVFEPSTHEDDRGVFLEWFRGDLLEQHIGHRLDLHQANWSTSRAGALRGVHFAEIPPGQAKYIVCVRGAIIDVVVDVRTGSPTFGQWESVPLDGTNRRAVYIAEGLGHGFMATEDDTSVVYLCSAPYAPGREHGVHPQDPALGIAWPTMSVSGRPLQALLSPKDAELPTLAEAARLGVLPTFEDATRFYAELDRN
ncbi:MAG: dTDP-4-dehydrorhamnose 3,5-epimerase family protein [Actinobacteria bacterium]|nr:dTDP-4-dehydrorhamnose 3,5-epimerase family protein [Actinomycetota bacterium]